MSKTPRTDTVAFMAVMGSYPDGSTQTESCVDSDFARQLERELNEANTTIAISEARQAALDNLWKEKLNESHAREAQLREALSLPKGASQHIKCICYGKCPTQVQVGYVCKKVRGPLPPSASSRASRRCKAFAGGA